MDKEIISRIKHIETFYEQAPPGYLKEEEERPEDCIPDEDCNREAREFLAKAPSKGLWMPLGKEVKVMQCWRCKQYGHRTGDRECPMFKSGNSSLEKFRETYEDPMYHFVEASKREENEKKKMWLQQLLDKSTTSDSTSEAETTKKNKVKKHKKSVKKHSKKKRKKTENCSSDSESEPGKELSTVDKVKKKKSKSSKNKKKKKHSDNSSDESDRKRKRTTSSKSSSKKFKL